MILWKLFLISGRGSQKSNYFILFIYSFYAMNTCQDSFRKKNSFITSQKRLLNNINIVENNKKMMSKEIEKKTFTETFKVKKNSFPSLTKTKK